MKAVVITQPGGPEVLELREVAQPQPAAGEVLVRVRATALNRADLLQREGHYPAPPGYPADIPGLEFAGEVAACGPGATLWTPGARVFGLTGGGAYAEYVVVHERTLAEVPKNLGWAEAAAVPEAFITAHDALWMQAALRPNERVLITAVGSGVGLAATQLARAQGAVPYGTSRTADKIERARAYGLEAGAVVRDPIAEFPELTKQWTGDGFDVVIDLAGGPYLSAGVQALGLKGRLILVGTVAGRTAELQLGPMLARRLTVKGTSLRARPLEEKIAATAAFARDVVPLLATGKLKPVIDRKFPLADVRAAHARLGANESFGKIVLEL
jgi:NADPH2:quinone reductase